MSLSSRNSVLILRLWIEPKSLDALRARIVQIGDSPRAEPVTTAAKSLEEIVTIVRDRLQSFVEGGDEGGSRPPLRLVI